MKIFQVDENLNSKRLKRECYQDSISKIFSYPIDLKGEPDDKMLESLLPKRNTLLTTDTNLIFDFTSFIPSEHAGIIVLGPSTNNPNANTLSKILRIFKQYKEKLKNWYKYKYDNFIIKITDMSIQIWHVAAGKLIDDYYI